ncbi:MAG: transposase [Deltaproteobacteria bacterium]|nr:transposase [Deltaproteobacteria bacterium]
MLTGAFLLPTHIPGLYQEMKGEVERRVEVDFKGWLKGMLEEVSVMEFEELVIGVPPYVRVGGRRNQRNGFYERSLDTVFGWIEGLRIPRPRVGGFTPSCLGKKYGRRQEVLNRVVTK